MAKKQATQTPSNFIFPKRLKVASDDNELELDSQVGITATYLYIKSKTKVGLKLTADQDYIHRLIKDKIFIVC